MAAEEPLTQRSHRSVVGAAVSLTLIAAIAGGLVAGIWRYTREPIADHEARRMLGQLNEILPAALYDNEPYRDVVLLPVDGPGSNALPVYRARRESQPVAAVLTTVELQGYSGPIRLLVAVDITGTVLGVRTVTHTETPGIGDFIESGKSEWMNGFAGHSASAPPVALWTVRTDGGEFDAVTGATITSRAAVSGVRRALQYFLEHQTEIFALPSTLPNSGESSP